MFVLIHNEVKKKIIYIYNIYNYSYYFFFILRTELLQRKQFKNTTQNNYVLYFSEDSGLSLRSPFCYILILFFQFINSVCSDIFGLTDKTQNTGDSVTQQIV